MSTIAEIEFRVRSLEQWRDKVDEDRGVIMGELGEIRGTQQAILGQLTALSEKLDDRPSRVELQNAMKSPRSSMRPKLTEMEVMGPWGLKLRLFGVSGIVILLIATLLVTAVTLLLLGRH
jgi:hypothetical protein